MSDDLAFRLCRQDSGYHHGAGARAAGQRLPRASFPYSDGDLSPAVQSDKLGVGPAREGGMALDLRPNASDQLVVQNVHKRDAVGVPHGDTGDPKSAVGDGEG